MTNTLINTWKKLWRITDNCKCLHTASIESQGLVPLPLPPPPTPALETGLARDLVFDQQSS